MAPPISAAVGEPVADEDGSLTAVGGGVMNAPLESVEGLPDVTEDVAATDDSASPCTRNAPCVPKGKGVESYPWLPVQSAIPFPMVQVTSAVKEIAGAGSIRCA